MIVVGPVGELARVLASADTLSSGRGRASALRSSRSWPSLGTIAVPTAKNSITWLPQPWLSSRRETPTIPSAETSWASLCIRSIASSRAS